ADDQGARRPGEGPGLVRQRARLRPAPVRSHQVRGGEAVAMIRGVKDLPVEGKRAFLRVDFNVPLTPARGVADDRRIRASLPTIHPRRDGAGGVVAAPPLGRPRGGPDPAYSLERVGARLADLLGIEVLLTDEPVGDGARKVVSDLRDGQLALLENLRF